MKGIINSHSTIYIKNANTILYYKSNTKDILERISSLVKDIQINKEIESE